MDEELVAAAGGSLTGSHQYQPVPEVPFPVPEAAQGSGVQGTRSQGEWGCSGVIYRGPLWPQV